MWILWWGEWEVNKIFRCHGIVLLSAKAFYTSVIVKKKKKTCAFSGIIIAAFKTEQKNLSLVPKLPH